MQAVIIAVITTAIGVVAAFWAARRYYTRSVKHRLAVYWLPAPSILYGADPETRKELSIQFRGETVNELVITEFLIANEGADPIRENIEPLTLTITNKSRIVDASVTYVQPEGRKIIVEPITEKAFRCDFPLLNPDEYFYIKLITDGRISKSDITCQIVAENLPPRIQIDSPSKLSIGPDEQRRDLTLLIPAVFILVLGAAVFLPMVALYQAKHAYFPFSGAKYHFIWWLSPALFIVTLLVLVLLFVTIAICGAAFLGEFPPNKRFKARRPYHAHLYGYGYPFPPPESDNALTRYPRKAENSAPGSVSD